MTEKDSVDSWLAAVAKIPARPDAWTPPAELDEYRLIKLLGRGGMGSVWLAEDRLLARHVAIKFIAHAAPDPATRERFAVEARAVARLAHVNVVTVHRFGEVAGRPYLVSEYIRGEPLDKLAKPIPWQRALELGIALSRGLAAAHRAGIVHRDIKPGNAILTAEGEAKLVDFGLAKLDHVEVAGHGRSDVAAAPHLTQQGAIAGTPQYLAPEVRAGDPADRRSDVYQIGCVLYELVAGRAPLLDALARRALAATEREVSPTADAIDVPSLAERLGASGMPSRFAAVVDRCLRRDPAERFESGDELREALERLAVPALGGELPEGNPYRGLAAFDAAHRALFFGRGAEIRAVIERLRERAFVLVTGDSGVGKSSLVRAGVLPHIADGALHDGLAWSSVYLVPSRRPLTALASLLAPLVALDESTTLAMLRDQPREVWRALRRVQGAERGVVIFIDQLEELVTIADRDEASSFCEVVAQLANGTPGLRVIATVRSDFLTRVAELPAIGADVARALYLLGPLTAEGTREAIVGPARAKGARFESDELVETLVSSVADRADHVRGRHAIELPLLAFTLAQLWDARDPATQTISARSLDAIGGVRGALARHADGVLDALLPKQREAARQLLLRLVTPERTRARRTADELGDRAVLDALVDGRLLVARGEEPPTFELAHERLIDGWPKLAAWLSEASEAIAVHTRLTAATADWERLGRNKDSLWRKRQLADLAVLANDTLAPSEVEFVRTSRRQERRRRVAVRAVVVAAPLLAISVYGGARMVARRDVARHVAENVVEADRELVTARAANADSARLRTTALAHFDTGKLDEGEHEWTTTLDRSNEARAAYARASRALEAALLLDTSRTDVRRELAEVTRERLMLAARMYRGDERAELAARLPLYDKTIADKLTAPARLDLAITPTASVTLLHGAGEVPVPPSLAPGSYVIVARAAGYATVRVPVVVGPGEQQRVELALPPASAVPAGFVYVPAGTFGFGSRDDEELRRFYATAPLHDISTGAFLIAKTETTYADWIAFLDEQPAERRAELAPRVDSSASVQFGGQLELRDRHGTWELMLMPTTVRYVARAGTSIEYADREHGKRQDWLRMPVTGISFEDAQAYTDWLSRAGRVPGARLCDEREWERAARGVDGRAFPAGDTLAPDDANIDVTYGRKTGGFGPDAVGSHPGSTSPYGLFDMSGNVWELTRSAWGNQIVMRGGAYYYGVKSAHLANRAFTEPTLRHAHTGFRVCADPAP
ncbi:MAG TPA: SUMF1/EgtB/PvdO family nonheme iron enzyme [Kofleriaceae bacterium]